MCPQSYNKSYTLNDLLTRFQYVRDLDSNPETKIISLLGTVDSQAAILTVEKTHFIHNETIRKQSIHPPWTRINSYRSSKNEYHPVKKHDNEIMLVSDEELGIRKPYATEFYLLDGVVDLNELTSNENYYWALALIKENIDENPTAKISFIWPATDVHIRRYDQQKLHIVKETPDMYQRIVKPFIDEMTSGHKLDWVYKILYENTEDSRIIYKQYNELQKDDAFILLPDTRWDGQTLESLYLVALMYRDDIKSIRDFRPEHRDWLIRINRLLKSVIPPCYNYAVHADELRIFIHYQPSYYHLHIHVVHIKHPGLSGGLHDGKAIQIDDAIEHLTFLGENGWMDACITYTIGENHPLWQKGLKDEVQRQLKEANIEEPPPIINSLYSLEKPTRMGAKVSL